MSIYDIAMLIVLGGAVWFGFWKGLAWQIASLAAVIVSYIVSVNFRDPVSQFIQAEEPWNRIGAMLILFLGTSLLIWTIYARVAKGLKKAELKGFDRQMGALLGAFKGAILCMVITIFSVSMLGDRAHDTIHHSTTGRYVVKGIGMLSSIIPAELAEYTDPHFEKFEEGIGHSVHQPIDNYPQHQGQPNHYPDGGQYSQDPGGLPSSQSPYQGRWQTPVNQTGYGTQLGYGNPQQGYGVPQQGTAQNYQSSPNGGYGNQANGQFGQPNQYDRQYNQNQQPSTAWQQPNTPSTGNQQYRPPAYGGQFTQPNQTQQPYGNSRAGQAPNWGDFNVSESSKGLILDALIEKGKEAAQNVFNGGHGQ